MESACLGKKVYYIPSICSSENLSCARTSISPIVRSRARPKNGSSSRYRSNVWSRLLAATMTMRLTLLNTVSAGGAGPTFVSVHPSGKHVLVANYAGGSVAVFPILADGGLGPASDINIQAKEMEKLRQELNQILATSSGQPLDQINKDTDRDFYLNAKEAIDYGLADRIVEKI